MLKIFSPRSIRKRMWTMATISIACPARTPWVHFLWILPRARECGLTLWLPIAPTAIAWCCVGWWTSIQNGPISTALATMCCATTLTRSSPASTRLPHACAHCRSIDSASATPTPSTRSPIWLWVQYMARAT